MPSAADLLTRWPALQVADRHARLQHTYRVLPGPIADALRDHAADAARAATGMWRRDTATWSRDAAVQQTIANRLGWLDSPALMAESLDRLRRFADGVKRDFSDVVLLGMGGSSLAPEVLRSILGTSTGCPRFQMVDSTDPAAVEAAATPAERTLYILASKSGGTIEPNSLAAHFRKRLEDAPVGHVPRWADHFVAITDAGTDLAERATREGFRETFINPSDIGGRYSALSYFGLVPAALMGQDLDALVGWALAMLASAEAGSPGSSGSNDPQAVLSPAVQLGLAMGAAARRGRDKVTLIVPPAFATFGLWVEQLVAESTGKSGVGVVPVVGEKPGSAKLYGADRLFVVMRLGHEPGEDVVRELHAHSPVITIDVPEPQALGAEFVRWEIATAVAAAILSINPFDEPNVKQAKDATRALLNEYQAKGQLPIASPHLVRPDGVEMTLSRAALKEAGGQTPEHFLSQVRANDYLAVLAYLGPAPALATALSAFRQAARDRTRAATTLGYGPRYLHSTGQLHKGGPNTGVFVLITATPAQDLPIPGEPFSFGTLEQAQALGDFASLDAAGRRALHIHLPTPDAHLLRNALQGLLSV